VLSARRPALPATARDCLFLAALGVASVVLYTGGLGFYSDDWAFLRLLETTDDRSLPGYMSALYEGDVFIRQRPVQVVYLAVLYAAFGLAPLGYHVVNAVALVAIAVLFYLVLRELGQPRSFAVAVAAVYAVMPNFSSDRFWLAAHQATLSVLFLLVAALAALRGGRASRGAPWLYGLSMAAMAASALAYEVTIPLLGAMIAAVAYRAKQAGAFDDPSRRRPTTLWLVAGTLGLAAIVVVKAATSVRVGVTASYPEYVGDLLAGTLRVDLGVYGIGFPYVLSWIFRHALDGPVLALGAVAGVATGAYVYRSHGDDPEREPEPSRRRSVRRVLAGLTAMALGYALFVVPTVLSFSSASLGNRIRIAASLGTAAVLVGTVAALASLVRHPRLSRLLYATAVAVLCASGFVVTNTLARFWSSAYEAQRGIVVDLRTEVPELAPGSALILDGVCLERGGAYVFTGHRDVRGVLTVRYGQPDIRGSAITKTPVLQARGISVQTVGEPDFFPYGRSLLVYNAAQRRAHRLRDRPSAERYFRRAQFDPLRDCLPGFSWRGPAPPID
jgi:hypothetical protein